MSRKMNFLIPLETSLKGGWITLTKVAEMV